jgi:hypothetical protein
MYFTESFISVPILALYSTRDITSNLSSAKMATKRFTIIPTKHHKDCSYYVEQQKSIYETINRRHFETVFNIPVLTKGIRSDIPVLISQSDCRNSLDTLH